MNIFKSLAALCILAGSPAFSQNTGSHHYPNLLEKMEASGEFAPMFPFQPTHDAPLNITNVATWPLAPGEMAVRGSEAGSQGFITADGDHFVDANGKVRRFMGTNICFSGCFPEKKDAERVAEELARYGINLVRLHYVHHQFPKDKIYPEKDSFLEPVQLERFDYFFSCLKKKGIYIYFQLNIARKFGAQNGFENATKLPWYNNGLDNFEPRMIELQKKYHRDILNHVNPYTGLAYKDDPAIGMLEIANENSIVSSWFNVKRYNFPNLTEPYASQLRKLWNSFLVDKYKSTAAMKKAWTEALKGDGTEYIPEGIFTGKPDAGWNLQLDKAAKGSFEFVKASDKDKLKGKYFTRVKIGKIGLSKNIPQFCGRNFAIKTSAPYCLMFKMRADKPMEVGVRLSQNHNPWHQAGLRTTVKCGTEWQDYKLNFLGSMDDNGVRLVISDFQPGTVDIADVSLVSGIDFNLPKNQKIEKGTVEWPMPDEWSIPWQRALDFTEFLGKLESDYFGQMYAHLKNVVKPSQPIAGTQLHYGFNKPQAQMDYVDVHSYWNHPYFPRKSWDSNNWQLRSLPLVNGGYRPGTNLTALSRDRILGKPYTVSEYDHPNLNFYSAEGDLMLASTAAFQNWSGLMQFAWTHSTNYFRTVQSQMFDLCSASQKLVHFPACYAMFVRGDVKTGDESTIFAETSETGVEIKKIALGKSAGAVNSEDSPLLKFLPLAIKSGKEIKELPELFKTDGRKVIRTEKEVPAGIKAQFEAKEVKSSTGEMTWNWQQNGAGFFTVDTENTKVFTGFVKGRTFKFNGMVLSPGKTRLDWLTMSMTLTNPSNGKASGSSVKNGTYLLALTGLCHNTGEAIVDLGRGWISCAKSNGGANGTEPVLCEGIPADLTLSGLAGKVVCYALGPDGNRTAQVKVGAAGKDAIVSLSPDYKTVWYELIVK